MEQMREDKKKENKEIINHCIFSGDADFIILSLLFHEPNIVLLKKRTANRKEYNFEFTKENNFLLFNEFLYISVLREYLDIEFCKLKNKIKFEYNIERFYDDFAFLCFLFGNDFIPALMNLDLDGIVFELVLNSYKNSIQKFNDYLTNDGIINFNNFKIFMNELSLRESEYLNTKYDLFKRIIISRKNNSLKKASLFEIYKEETLNDKNNDDKYEQLKERMNKDDNLNKKIINTLDAEILSKDKEYGKYFDEYFFHKFVTEYNNDRFNGIKLYYQEKFNFDIEEEKGQNELNLLIMNYIEGLQWNLFYFKGLLSWNWNYKFNYCPLITSIARYNYLKDQNEIINNNINDLIGKPLPPYILQCLIFPSFDLIPINYHEIENIIPEYYSYNKQIDNNGNPFPSQIIIKCPKIYGKKMIQDLIDFDKAEFEKTKNYNIIKENYRKVYLYNTKNIKEEYNMKRKNEIFKEQYALQRTDIMFPSIESINNYKYIEGYINRNIGKNKIIQINSLFIYVYLDEKKYKKIINMIIDEIFKEKIISFGYPQIKLGIITGLYYNNKYYRMEEESKILKESSYQKDYEDQIKKDYEYLGLKILDLSVLIEVIPIININQGKFEFDYEFKYLIPLEITSLNKINDVHREYLKNILKMNNIIDEKSIKLDKEMIEKEKEIFFYDENNKKNKQNDIKDKNKNNNKSKFMAKKGDKKKEKTFRTWN